MALTRKDKEQLVNWYRSSVEKTKNIVVLKQHWVPVNEVNKIRKDMIECWWKFNVVKKRVFLRLLKEEWFSWCELNDLDWSVVVLYSYDDEFAPLKVASKYKKLWSKEKKSYSFEYVWWWFEKAWQDSKYVTELAWMPWKIELISKFAYLLNYPLQSFAYALDQISKKGDKEVTWNSSSEQISVEKTDENKTD